MNTTGPAIRDRLTAVVAFALWFAFGILLAKVGSWYLPHDGVWIPAACCVMLILVGAAAAFPIFAAVDRLSAWLR